jgi:aminopeptidase N
MFLKSLSAAFLAGAVLFAAPAFAADAPAVDPAVIALGDVPHGRLTDAVVPSAYRIDTRFDPSKDGFSGDTEIDVTLAQPSRYIDMHGRNLAMTSATATAGGKTYAGKWYQVDPTGVARLVFDRELPAGKATLKFAYTGQYQDNASGLFHAKVGDDWYGWSQFESIDARSAFPSFDEPGFKTPFTVTIRTPAGQKAVSNAPEVSSTLEDGWQVHRFAPTLPLPTYLVAMMSGPFAIADGAVPPTPERTTPLPLRVVSEQTNAADLSFALENSKQIVALLEDYFGQPFPFPKLDQITSPLMNGAMENAGADLYGDAILVMGQGAPIDQKKTFGMVVAHELSHQWFGDMVTPRWWDDIWLNESFANWMGYHIGDQWRPDLHIGDGALAEGFRAMDTDSLIVGRPIHQPIATNDQTDAAFDTITYGKGGQVVSMIAGFLGHDKFREGVRHYMSLHRYGNATSKDFFSAMADVAGDPKITAAMQSFTDQQGVPLITVAESNGKYTVSQSRYAPIGVNAPATTWGVPVCMRRGEARECQLLTDQSAPFAIGGKGALMPNAGGEGYYRFELPTAQWDALIAEADRLDGGEALALADSLSASFNARRASPAQLIALATKLASNPDPYAADAAFSALGHFRRAGFFDADATAAYRKWVGGFGSAEFTRLGFDPRAGAYADDDPLVRQRRESMAGNLAFARDPKFTETLKQAADAYLAGQTDALDPAYLDLALDAYLDRGGLEAAKALADKALASDDPVFRPSALAALGTSGNPAIAHWLLDEPRDPRMRSTEHLRAALRIATTPETRDIGYAWVSANLDQLLKGSSGIFLATAAPMAFSNFCDARKADEIATRFGPLFTGTAGALDFQRTVEEIRNCAALKAARGAEINAAVRQLK